MPNKSGFIISFVLSLILFAPKVGAKAPPPNFKVTNEMIYQKLIEIEKRQAVFEEKFKQIDERFEQIDKRFEELREDINKRFDDMFHYLNILVAIFSTFTIKKRECSPLNER
jgi:hypothetical protein